MWWLCGAPKVPEVSVGGRRLALPAVTVRRVVRGVLAAERSDTAVSVTFVGRDGMRRLNRQYKGRDEPTDVIAFTLAGAAKSVIGDVYVCPWVAERQARDHDVPVRQELIRLVVHGVLHVLGYDHGEGAARARSGMWRRQERYVERFS